MNPSEMQTVLLSAVEVVLETACCAGVFESREENPPAPHAGETITVRVKFEGKPAGRLCLRVPPGLALVLGARFLGREEWEVSADQAVEVACELANMICGSVLSNLCEGAAFRIALPQLAKENDSPDCRCDVCRWFDLGDGSLTACMKLQEAL